MTIKHCTPPNSEALDSFLELVSTLPHGPQDRPLTFTETELGCFISTSHKVNGDGYLNKWWRIGGERVQECFHRVIFRAHKQIDSIPEDCQIDHICRNPSCCNPRHMWMIPTREHHFLTKKTLNTEIREQSRLIYEASGKALSGDALGKEVGFHQTTVSGWIRDWKAEDAEDRERWGIEGEPNRPD